jgi:pimeloyl-ACP methyl ester carboxylesterase
LRDRAAAEVSLDPVFALAELSYLTGRRTGERRLFLSAALYAHVYLFYPREHGPGEAFDPRFRFVCELYNTALGRFLEGRRGEAVIQEEEVDITEGRVRISVDRSQFPLAALGFDSFHVAAAHEIRGLGVRHVAPGLGVPLIATRERPPPGDLTTPDSQYRGLFAHATAFLRMHRLPRNAFTDPLEVTLELYWPIQKSEIEVSGRRIPLEVDWTAPIAFALEGSRIWAFELGGFLSGDFEAAITGLHLTAPYSPGKVPVVFVHGTASSPARWAELFNALHGQKELRERFHCWFFVYNTGSPILYSAHKLRESLQDAVARLDPEGKDPALRQMVLVGHSQGGLLVRLQATDSGAAPAESRFLAAAGIKNRQELDGLGLSAELVSLLEKVAFFRRLPFIRRAVFIATPHRGSFLSDRWYARLASSFVALPKNILKLGSELIRPTELGKLNPYLREMPTSIRNMEPGSPFVKILEELGIHQDVTVHSVIPVQGGGPTPLGNDGVVEYSSAHLDGAASEYVVPWNHSCQSQPLVIAELRRILLEHLEGLGLAAGTQSSSKP